MRTRATKAAKIKGRTTKPRPSRHAEDEAADRCSDRGRRCPVGDKAEVLETYEDGSWGDRLAQSTSKNTLEGLVRTYVFTNGKC